MLGGYDLGCGLAEYQQNNRQADSGNNQAGLFFPVVHGDGGGQSGGGGVNQRISEENDREKPFGLIDKPGYFIGSLDLSVDEILEAEPLE